MTHKNKIYYNKQAFVFILFAARLHPHIGSGQSDPFAASRIEQNTDHRISRVLLTPVKPSAIEIVITWRAPHAALPLMQQHQGHHANG
jgi:hypothetical protein